MMEKLISLFLEGNLIQLNAYETISTNALDMIQLKIPIIIEFLNQAGKFATVSGWNKSF